MKKTQRKDFLIVTGCTVALLTIMILARQSPVNARTIGGQWCSRIGQDLQSAISGKTSRPPYHQGDYISRKKLTIICKKRLH